MHQISNQYTGVLLNAQLKVVPKTDSHLVVTLNQPRYSEVHTTLQHGVETQIPEGQLQYKPLTFTTEPFEVKLNKGVVSNKFCL